MIETQVLRYMEEISGVACYMEIPPEPPETFIVIERTGGTANEIAFNTATFAVQTYGGSLYQAAELAKDILPGLLRMKYDVDNVSSIEVTAGPYNYTDTENKRYRYQMVCSISFYETED